MPYSPENNPYIPGDPYSYDLKWIVQQIKELNKELSYLKAVDINPEIITSASQIITPANDVTIVNAAFVIWSKVAYLFLTWKSANSITVQADGNLTDVTVGTLAEDKAPVLLSRLGGYVAADQSGLDYNITNAGILTLKSADATGSSRTIASNSNMISTGMIMLK